MRRAILVALGIGTIISSAAAIGIGTTMSVEPHAMSRGLYEVALFHAERHSIRSVFNLTLTGFSFELSSCARSCGDGVVDQREECDDGVNDGGYGRCGRDCRWDQWCGDGVVQPAFEQCDDSVNGVRYSDAGCSPSCRWPPRCGDGLIDAKFGEQCDGDAGCSGCRITGE